MILDGQLLFSDAQAVTAAAGSTNTLDLSAVRDIGTGEDLYVFVSVDVAMADTGSNSTLTVTLQGDSTTSITPDGARDLFIIPATSAAGSIFYAKISPSIGSSDATNYQYLRLLYTPNNGDLSAGTFTAGIVGNIQKATLFADGITIS